MLHTATLPSGHSKSQNTWQSYSTYFWPDLKQTMKTGIRCILISLPSGLWREFCHKPEKGLVQCQKQAANSRPHSHDLICAPHWKWSKLHFLLVLLLFKWVAPFPCTRIQGTASWFVNWFQLQRIKLFSSWTLKTRLFFECFWPYLCACVVQAAHKGSVTQVFCGFTWKINSQIEEAAVPQG